MNVVDRSSSEFKAFSSSTSARRSSSWASWPTPSAGGSIPSTVVTYIIDRNINYTNVCVADCEFCAFYRRPKHDEGYVLSFEQIGAKIDECKAIGGVQILLQGGHNPYIPFEWYLDLHALHQAPPPDPHPRLLALARSFLQRALRACTSPT